MDLNKLPQVHVNNNTSMEINVGDQELFCFILAKKGYILVHPVISAEQYSCLFSLWFLSKVKFYNTILLQCDPSA